MLTMRNESTGGAFVLKMLTTCESLPSNFTPPYLKSKAKNVGISKGDLAAVD